MHPCSTIQLDKLDLPERSAHLELHDLLGEEDRQTLQSSITSARAQLAGPAVFDDLGAPRARVAAGEYAPLLRRLCHAGIVTFVRQPLVVNGLFAVPKSGGDRQRLIIDARWANHLFPEPPSPDLPSPTELGRLHAGHDQLFVAAADVANFYHNLAVPREAWPLFCLPPCGVTRRTL